MLFMFWPLHAKKVELEKAERVAQQYVQSKYKLRTASSVRLKYTATNKNKEGASLRAQDASVPDTVFYYVFNVNETIDGGFVMVAGDDLVRPVLGYSDNGNYNENNLPPNFSAWMNGIQEQIAYAQTQNLPQSTTVREEWEAYQHGNISFSTNVAGPLIQTKWDQWRPYNNLCPSINNTLAPTGCVATTMAQIMNYHQFPASGSGESAPYITPSGIFMPAESFEVDYDWNNMLNIYGGGETQQQQNAVATLMYHGGLSVKMQYDANESGAYNEDVIDALINNFGYDRNLQIKYRNDDTEWENLLKTQIDAGLPIYYTGQGTGGHAFVCDGYDGAGKFHFNWGWGGTFDGYFVTSALEPDNYNFNYNQYVITDIKPMQGYLKALNVSEGTLSPAFRPYVFDYTVHVNASVESIAITGITDISGATVTGNVTDTPLTLDDYTDVIIKVTLANGDSQNYRVSVIRGEIPPASFTWEINTGGQRTQIEIGAIAGETCIIDWGDGTEQELIIGKGGYIADFDTDIMNHTYDIPGTYQVTILGENEAICPLVYLGWNVYQRETEYAIVEVDVRKASSLLHLAIRCSMITQVDVSRNKELIFLDLISDKLSSLNVTHNLQLRELACSGNQLVQLDLSNNIFLSSLHCNGSNLRELDVSHLVALRVFYCGENQIKQLNLENNTALKVLGCGNNHLTKLDVTNCKRLDDVSCQGNQLTELDVTQNLDLTCLSIVANFLTSIDLSKQTKLEFFYAMGNQLTHLDISNTTFTVPDPPISEYKEFNCDNNAIPLIGIYTINEQLCKEQLEYSFGEQILPDSIVLLNTPIAIDTVFYGQNTVFDVSSGALGTDYLLNNGEITFLTPGIYSVSISNPTITDSNGDIASVRQTFTVENTTHTVTFAGEGVDIAPQTIEYGNHATQPENPERTGYNFDGWFTDNATFADEWVFETDVVTQDTTLYAKWKWPTGIAEIERGDLKIYPNIVEDVLQIEVGALAINRIEIVSLFGESIYRFNTLKNQLNVSALPQGIYFVKIETEKGIVTKKFVKK
jgi:uncharacterized repeat protein (TIGR02543 family)